MSSWSVMTGRWVGEIPQEASDSRCRRDMSRVHVYLGQEWLESSAKNFVDKCKQVMDGLER